MVNFIFGNNVLGSFKTSNLSKFFPLRISLPNLAIRTASLVEKAPAVFGRIVYFSGEI